MSGRRYRGRRGAPRLLIPLCVLALALVLLAVNLLLHKTPKAPAQEEPQTPVEETETGTETQEETEPAEPAEPTPPPIAVIELNGDVEQINGVYRVGDTAFETYTYVDSTAQKYASCVNQEAESLAGVAKVYAMAIPLSSGITLPDALYGESAFDDQKAAEEKIMGYMNSNVVTVPLYDALMQHRGEYIYYRTDHHWSGLGAYYAYVEYCKAAGLTPRTLESYRTVDFPGYLGSFYYNSTNKNAQLGANPDVVTAYFPNGNAPMTVTDKNNNVLTFDSVIYDESSGPAAYKYGAYIYGDNPFTEIHNESISDGSAAIVVKESFGNAYVPFMVDHYENVYVIDYRYWHGSIADFAKNHNVKDVLFCNNLSAIRNNSLVGSLYGVL